MPTRFRATFLQNEFSKRVVTRLAGITIRGPEFPEQRATFSSTGGQLRSRQAWKAESSAPCTLCLRGDWGDRLQRRLRETIGIGGFEPPVPDVQGLSKADRAILDGLAVFIIKWV